VKFKIDENLPGEFGLDLRALGHDAETVYAENLAGAKDPLLLAAASSEQRILLTLDKGIANLQQYPAEQHSGVVLFRPVRSGRQSVLAFIRERLPDLLGLARFSHKPVKAGVNERQNTFLAPDFDQMKKRGHFLVRARTHSAHLDGSERPCKPA
jgi:predicted nuclease of predicted toxin-antitoxin system